MRPTVRTLSYLRHLLVLVVTTGDLVSIKKG
jgi:hypothetical protein